MQSGRPGPSGLRVPKLARRELALRGQGQGEEAVEMS